MPVRLLRRHDLRVLLLSGVAAALATVALGLTLVVRTNQSEQYRQQTAENCQALERLKGLIRGTFQDGRKRAETNPALDPGARAALLAYYDRQLHRYRAEDCPTP